MVLSTTSTAFRCEDEHLDDTAQLAPPTRSSAEVDLGAFTVLLVLGVAGSFLVIQLVRWLVR